MSDRLTEDDRARLDELFREVAPRLFVRAMTLTQGDRARAEDLVQETFRAAVEDWTRFRTLDHSSARGYLFGVLRHKEVDSWRASRRLVYEAPPSLPDPHDVDERAIALLDLADCWKIVQKMSPVQHRVAVLHWLAGWSTIRIAEHLDISSVTVRVHLKNARDMLKQRLGPPVHDDVTPAREVHRDE